VTAASDTAPTPLVPGGRHRRTRVAAVAIIVALAALTAFAMFSGPTTVTLRPPATTATPHTAPPSAEPDNGNATGVPGD